MATIEPRLIHLLNESTATPRPHHAELPPIKGLGFPKSSGRPHPIEPDAGRRSDGSTDTNGGQLAAQQPRPSLYPVGDEGSASAAGQRREPSSYTTDRTIHNHISSQDLRMILDDTPTPEFSEDHTTKKRPSKEDFVQLPQPLKKQKSGTQQHIFPPIIVGLLEPPLNAALFPPISSGSFDDRPHSEPPQALSITKPPEIQNVPEDIIAKPAPSPSPEADKTPTGKAKRRAAKPRRKWSEEETNHLLKGVSKHGVGRWTDILADKEYNFNERSAGDLKDRFRTCCPEELRANLMAKKEAAKERHSAMASENKPRKGLMSENILNDTEEDVDMDRAQSVQNDSDSAMPKQRKSRAHRKKMEDLAELGIKGPFKKSHRRERRPFSDQDDREILEGFEFYGPQWTKIQRDPRFNLSSRQPTDLRDRLRNKYPERFASTEKTTMQVKDQSGPGSSGPGPNPNPTNNLLEPSVNMAIENSLNNVSVAKSALLEPHQQLNRTNSKDDIPRWSLLPPASMSLMAEQPPESSLSTHPHTGATGFYWSEGGGGGLASGAIGEMDISRLLLDDTQLTGDQPSDKRGQG